MTKYVSKPAIDVATIAHALGSQRRVAVVDQLSRGPTTTTRLAEVAGTSLPTVHQHLEVLRTAGVIRSTKQGRTVSHWLEPDRLETLADWIVVRRSFWSNQLDALAATMEDRSEQ